MTGLNFNSIGPDHVHCDCGDQVAKLPADDGWQARSDAEARARQAEYAAQQAAWAKQDDDFHALSVTMSFVIEYPGHEGGFFEGYGDPHEWEFVEDEAVNAVLVKQVVREIADTFAPWLTHYQKLGLIGEDQEGGPSFSLVYRAEDEALAPAGLAAASGIRAPIASLPGATLVIQTSCEPLNATLLFNSGWPLGETRGVVRQPMIASRCPVKAATTGSLAWPCRGKQSAAASSVGNGAAETSSSSGCSGREANEQRVTAQ